MKGSVTAQYATRFHECSVLKLLDFSNLPITGGRRNWKRRWFVLRSYNLAYYSTMNDKDPLWEGVAVSYERVRAMDKKETFNV